MVNIEGDTVRNRRRSLPGAAGRAAVILLGGALALTACGSDKGGGSKSNKAVEHHTVVLEVTSDYGRPIAINYFGTATGPRGMVPIGKKGEGDLSAESPWKATLTVNGKDPWVSLSANGTGCLGRATGGDACETGAIPHREDIAGTGTTTCRILIDGKVVAKESYTYPEIIPVNCLTPRGGKAR